MKWRAWADKAVHTVADLESRYASVVATTGRLAMLAGALGAAMPAIGQLWHLQVLIALATLGHAAAIAGLAVSLGGRKA